MNFSVQFLSGNPGNTEEWNQLAIQNSNIYQSTYYDAIQSFFNKQSIYIEIRNDNKLTGGVKLYLWESRKLGALTAALSKNLTQFGEMLTCFPTDSSEFAEMKLQLNRYIEGFLDEKKIVIFTVSGMFGNQNLLVDPAKKPVFEFIFSAGFVDINKPENEIFSGFNRNTQRNLKKADAAQLEFYEVKDIEQFLPILSTVYSQQHPPKHPPSSDYLRHIYNALYTKGMVDIHAVKQNNEILSITFFEKYGDNVYSAFGGSVKNDVGAGQFIYWQLMKKYRQQGYKKFYFGQVANSVDEMNTKFSVGITNFKKGFGLVELESFKKNYVLSNYKNKLWELLLKIYS